MKPVGTYFADKAKPNQDIHNKDGRCEIYGCPLAGTMSTAINSPYYCRFHIGIKYELCAEITLKIKKYESLFNALDIALRPDIKFGHDIARAEHEVRGYLIRKNIGQLYEEGNLYKTSQNILNFLHKHIKLEPIGEQNA